MRAESCSVRRTNVFFDVPAAATSTSVSTTHTHMCAPVPLARTRYIITIIIIIRLLLCIARARVRACAYDSRRRRCGVRKLMTPAAVAPASRVSGKGEREPKRETRARGPRRRVSVGRRFSCVAVASVRGENTSPYRRASRR